MHMTIQELQYSNQSHRLNEPLLKWTLSNLLNALSFLQDEAKVIHTGKVFQFYYGFLADEWKQISMRRMLC